jgi:hypothetical protein
LAEGSADEFGLRCLHGKSLDDGDSPDGVNRCGLSALCVKIPDTEADMEVMATMRIKPDALDIIERTTFYPVAQGYVWQRCIVREADGQLVAWDIPLSPIGQVR